MKFNQEELIKIYLRVKSPKISDKPYYDINTIENIFYLYDDKNKKKPFEIKLDKIFTDEHNNSFLYNQTCSGLIKDCLNGLSFCFISHGETLSDKLITLIGDTTDESNEDKYKGIFPRVLLELYNYIYKNKTTNSDLNLNFSFLCINNNKLIDLNNFIDKDITNFKGDNYLKEGKTIQADKNLINYVKKLQITNIKNTLSFIFNNISLFIKLEKENNDNFYSTSHFVIILYLTNNKGDNISTLSFILLNGSEKINLVENNINFTKKIDYNSIEPERKKKTISATKWSIITQNAYNSIIYLIKQNKKINMNNNFKKEIEEDDINIKESKYISNLTAALYKICFDWRIKNIKYIIFGNIYPNIGYYKSVKDSIFFLNEFYKINNREKILLENQNNSDSEDYEILNSSLFELEYRVNQQNLTIDALNDLINKKNQKINFIQDEYNCQVNQLKKSLGFVGDINVLLSGNEYTKEGQRARKIRESGTKLKFLSEKIVELEKKLKNSNEQIDKFKSKEKLRKENELMVKYITSLNDTKNNKEDERKKNSIMLEKLDLLEKELKNKNIIINKLQNDINDKNNIIKNFSSLIYINKNNSVENTTNELDLINKEKEKHKKYENTKNNEYFLINNQKINNLEKLKKEYESRLKDEKDFWTNMLDEKDKKIEILKNKYKSLYENNSNLEKDIKKVNNENQELIQINNNYKLEINKYKEEFLKLNEILMNIIHKFKLYFLQRAKSSISLITIQNNVSEFSKIILNSEQSINFTTFPKLHTLLETKNKLGINYKTIINKTNITTPKLPISKSQKNLEEKEGISSPPTSSLTENKNQIFNILDNYINNDKNKNNSDDELIIPKEKLAKMHKYEIIIHCLKLNERIKEIEKYITKYNDINLENDENKKQIKYLNFKLNNIKKNLEEQIAINNRNYLVITSQNRTIDKFYNNLDIKKEEKNNLTLSLSPTKKRKILHFNKSQVNLKINNDIGINNNFTNNELYIGNKKYDLFYNKNKNNSNKKNRKKKNIQLPIDYYSIDSDNHINNTKHLYKSNSNTKISSQNTITSKFNSYKNEFSSSYINFHSQN